MHYPQSASGLGYASYPVGPVAEGITVTAHATANTKGSYTEVVAATPFECNQVIIRILRSAAIAGLQYLVDIAVGGVGVETVVVPDLLTEGTNTGTSFGGARCFQLPLKIAGGARVSARCACSTGGNVVLVAITLVKAGDTPGVASYTNFGADATDSGGLMVDPGPTVDVKGSWVQFSASTPAVIQSLSILASMRGNTDPLSATWAVDIGIGGAGAEQVLVPDLRLSVSSSVTPRPMQYASGQVLLTYIPSGTRLAVRASCTINDATDRLIDIALLGGTAPAETPLSYMPFVTQQVSRGRRY